MPRKYKKRPYRKRTYRKKRYKKKNATVSATYPLSNKFTFRTRYVELDQVLDPGIAGIPVNRIYRLNSLFDPNYSGAGHQPIGFDQIMPMYDHYTVIGARVKITASNLDRDPQRVILQIKDGVTTSTNIAEMMENGRTRSLMLSGSDAGGSTKNITVNYSAKGFFGRNPMDSDKQQGNISSSPLEGAFLHITVAPIEADNSGKVIFTITIEYIAILTEPKQLSQS